MTGNQNDRFKTKPVQHDYNHSKSQSKTGGDDNGGEEEEVLEKLVPPLARISSSDNNTLTTSPPQPSTSCSDVSSPPPPAGSGRVSGLTKKGVVGGGGGGGGGGGEHHVEDKDDENGPVSDTMMRRQQQRQDKDNNKEPPTKQQQEQPPSGAAYMMKTPQLSHTACGCVFIQTCASLIGVFTLSKFILFALIAIPYLVYYGRYERVIFFSVLMIGILAAIAFYFKAIVTKKSILLIPFFILQIVSICVMLTFSASFTFLIFASDSERHPWISQIEFVLIVSALVIGSVIELIFLRITYRFHVYLRLPEHHCGVNGGGGEETMGEGTTIGGGGASFGFPMDSISQLPEDSLP